MRTLVIVGLQNDFLPGGALDLKGGDQIIGVINSLLPHFDHVVASLDRHPINHVSFAKTHQKQVGDIIEIDGIKQVLWPAHCVSNSHGADLSDDLDQSKIEQMFYKGEDPGVDCYSIFLDQKGRPASDISTYLKKNDLNELYFVGIAANYCVKDSTYDALRLGYDVTVIADGCLSIGLNEQQEKELYDQMRAQGIKIIQSKDLS